MGMANAMLKARLGVKAQVVLPKPVREVLGLKPGDEFAFVIRDGEVQVVRAPAEGDDPFACFTEWASDADRKGYADL
jgi:antitoxin PrlF